MIIAIVEYLFLGVIILIGYFYYTFIYKPKKLYDFYSTTLQELGYKVLKFPFKPFKVPYKERYQESFDKHKDSFYYDKHVNETYDIVLHNIMDQVTLDLVNPEMIKEFLSMEKIFLFPKRKIYIANLQRLLGHGVTFSEGQVWKSKRKTITSVFTFDFLKSIIPNISKICDKQLNQMETEFKVQNPTSDQVKTYIFQLGFKIFSNVLMVSFFGMDSDKCKIQGKTPCQFINQALRLANSQGTQPLGYLFGPWIFNLGLKQRDRQVNKVIKTFREFATALVKQKIQVIKAEQKDGKQKIYKDLIEALVNFYHLGNQAEKSDQKYSIEDVIDQFCTLFAAGTDTTSHFFMMSVYYIVENPEVQARLRQQIEEIFLSEKDFTYENLKKMKYIECIQEEVNRLYGPTNGVFLRQADKDTQILNIPIQKDTSVSVKPMLNHYNAEFFEDPLSFKPQRWQKPNNLHPYTLWNFSAGPRSCIGKQLALLQTKIALIKLFKRYKHIKLEKSKKEWQMQFLFLYTPQKFMTILKN